MQEESNIAELAVAAWRLERWLNNLHAERKMAAKSALRIIKKYLTENGIEIDDLTGTKFDIGLAVSVISNESDETDEDRLIISETVKPIIKKDGAVIQFGQVVIGDKIKEPKENNEINTKLPPDAIKAEQTVTKAAKAVSEKGEAMPEADKTTAETGRENRSKLGACIAVLQIVLIAAVCAVFVQTGHLTAVSNQLLETETTEETVASGAASELDLSEIENSLTDIESRLNSVEDGIAVLTEKINDSGNKMTEDKTGISQDTYITYIVQKGDTLYQICQDHGIDFYADRAVIMRMNYMNNADTIEVGQKLLLPVE